MAARYENGDGERKAVAGWGEAVDLVNGEWSMVNLILRKRIIENLTIDHSPLTKWLNFNPI